MLVVNRFTVPADGGDAFVARARAALSALGSRPGYLGGRIGRSPDEPTAWVLATEWEGIGAYRRALSSYDAKLHAHPLLGEALTGPDAFEVLYADGPGGAGRERPSGRAADADVAGPGGRA